MGGTEIGALSTAEARDILAKAVQHEADSATMRLNRGRWWRLAMGLVSIRARRSRFRLQGDYLVPTYPLENGYYLGQDAGIYHCKRAKADPKMVNLSQQPRTILLQLLSALQGVGK